jgi:hypothetical protein
MAKVHAGVCIMCGRTLGYAVDGAFLATPGGRSLERHGRQFRCGYCHGGVMFEPEVALPPEWAARTRRTEAARTSLTAARHRRAG